MQQVISGQLKELMGLLRTTVGELQGIAEQQKRSIIFLIIVALLTVYPPTSHAGTELMVQSLSLQASRGQLTSSKTHRSSSSRFSSRSSRRHVVLRREASSDYSELESESSPPYAGDDRKEEGGAAEAAGGGRGGGKERESGGGA